MKNNVSKKICVFCGSSSGKNLFYHNKVKEVGKLIADLKRSLKYVK